MWSFEEELLGFGASPISRMEKLARQSRELGQSRVLAAAVPTRLSSKDPLRYERFCLLSPPAFGCAEWPVGS